MEPLTAEAGDIEIRIPAYIFKDRNKNAVGKPYLGISTKKDSDSGFYYSIDTKNTDTLNDDEIVIKNFATITGDQTFRCNVTYWSDQAHAVKDGFENTFKASTTLRDGSEIKYQKDSNDLTVKYKTSTDIEKINPVNGGVTYPKLYKNWQSSWGTNSAGTTDYAQDHENGYFYVAWPVTTVLAQWPTQPGKLNDMTVAVSTDAGTASDTVAATVKGYTFNNNVSLPTKNEDLDNYQSGYIITAHKASEFEASGKDSICITADIKTSFTGVDGYTSGAGVVQTYNYDSLTRSGGGGTFIPYKYAPSPAHDDESDGFISLLQISDMGEILPLKSRTQPNKSADNAWDFVMTGEADGTDELTADYVNNEPAATSETDGTSPLNALLLDEPETENTNTGATEPETSGGETETERQTESQTESETESQTEPQTEPQTERQTESETETETSTTSLLDEVLDITDAGADEGTKVYGKKYYTMELVDDLLILEGEDLRAGDYQFDNIPYIKIQGIAASADRDDPNISVGAGTGEWNVSGAEVLTWKPGNEAIEGLTIYYKVGNGAWQEYDYAANKGELAGAGINGVTAIKAEYQSYYGYSAIQVFTNVDIIKTQHVMDAIGDKASVTLWNVDSMRAYDQAGHLLTAHAVEKYGGTLRDHLVARDEAYKHADAAVAITEDMKNKILDGTLIQLHDFDNIELTKAFIESKASKKVSYTNDTANERVTADYTLEAYLTGQSDYKSVLNEIVTRQTNDTFYDLLPMGMNYAKDSVVANLIGTSTQAKISVEQVTNFRDTGRTLLIFHVSTDKDNYNNYRSGYTLKFKAYYPWEEIQEYGRTPRNSMAYKSGEGNIEGYPDNGGRIKEGALLVDLDGIDSDVKDTVYADVNSALIWNTASVNGFSKKVKAIADEGYKASTTAYEGQKYSYKLRYGSEESTSSEGIILYDVLENNYGSNEYWKGTFESIDTTAAENKGIQPVIYYSTKDGIIITNESAPDLTDTSVWSRTIPENKADVTAIAVDLSTKQDGTPFVLEENAAVSVIINMKAPDDGVAYEENGILAYNTSWIKATTKNTASTTETTAVTQSDATTVALTAPSVIVAKVNDGGLENDTFELTLNVTGASADTEYPVTLPADEDGNPQTDVLRTDADGNGSYTGTLKGGESYSVKLPYGAKYMVSEDPGSKYAASYIVSGENAKIAKVGDKAEAGEILSTGEETVNEFADVTITYTNDSTSRMIQIWKQIYGRYENRSDHTYDFRLDVTGKAGDKYKAILPDGTEDEISLGLDGKASYDFTLKGSEVKEGAEILTVELPFDSTYQVTELMAENYGKDYKPSYRLIGNGNIVNRKDEGKPGEALSTAVETVDKEDSKPITIKFTNTGIPANLHIQKKTTGTAASDDDMFEYIAHFTGLNPGETYNLDGYKYIEEKETPEGLTMFTFGATFNSTIKSMVNPDAASPYSVDTSVTKFIHSKEAPAEDIDTVVVSTDDSEHEIVAWFKDGVVYWYSEAEKVYLNSVSAQMFRNFTGLTNAGGFEDVDTSLVTGIEYMFYGDSALTDLSGISGWDTSNVRYMNYTFCKTGIKDVGALVNWDTRSLLATDSLFRESDQLTNVDGLINWDVSKVTSFWYTFYKCSSLTNVDGLINWDVSKAANLSWMFDQCSSLTNVNGLANWDISNVTSLSNMFYYATNLSDISGLAKWNTSKVTSIDYLFSQTKIRNVNALADWDVSNVTDLEMMFYRCWSLSDISALANWDVSSVTCLDGTFRWCGVSDLTPLSNWDVSNVEDFDGIFRDAVISDVDALANWDTSSATTFYQMFRGATRLCDISGLANWETGNVTDFRRMFINDGAIADASMLSNWNVNLDAEGIIHGAESAFAGCPLLEERPSKYPTWYSAYRGSNVSVARSMNAVSLMSLDDTSVASPLALSNDLDDDKDKVFDVDDYSTADAAKANADSGLFVADANGEAYYVFHLKNGAFIDIKDLNPEVQYEITEVGNSYLPSYTVTEGSEYTISDSGKKETPNSDLSTRKETLTAGSSISYLFTNKKDADHNVTITKKVDGDIASVTDQFDYKAFISGLTPGKEYNIKKTTAPVGNTEGTFDFSKYDVSGISYELTDELINTFAGYMHYDGYDKYYFDNDGNGLGITCNDERVDGFDSFYVEEGYYYTQVVFVNSSTDEKAETYMNEEDTITAYSLRDPDTEEVAKTIDLSPYVRKDYMEIEEEDLRILDGAEFVNGDITFNCSVVNTEDGNKLQIIGTYTRTEDGISKEITKTLVGDSFSIGWGTIYLVDSNTGERLLLFNYADQVSFSIKSASETTTFTADENGNATLEWTMKANDSYEIMGLPEGATYKVTEAGAEKYIASYEITDNNDADGVLDTVVKVKDENFFRNKALSTAKETVDLYEDVVITFTNTAPIPILPSTGSNTALLLTLFGLAGIAGYGIYETLRRRKRNNMAV